MPIDDFYELDIVRIKEEIKKRKPRSILLQIPEGLKHFFPSVVERVKQIAGEECEVNIDASPTYGSCLMDLTIMKKYDLVIHFGHTAYPYWTPPDNVVLVNLISRNNFSSDTLQKFTTYLNNAKIKRVSIYTTAQHTVLVPRIISTLKDSRITIVNNVRNPVIFGCWFSDLDKAAIESDAVVVISGGKFHALGVGLRLTKEIPVVVLDPYRDSFWDASKEIYRLKKIRYSKILKAMNARSWAIIVGTAGQRRTTVIKALTKAMLDKGKNFYLAEVTYLTKDTLANLDNQEIDAFSITSCPRLAIEDLATYHKPVLTPGETMMAIEGKVSGRYIFPW